MVTRQTKPLNDRQVEAKNKCHHYGAAFGRSEEANVSSSDKQEMSRHEVT